MKGKVDRAKGMNGALPMQASGQKMEKSSQACAVLET